MTPEQRAYRNSYKTRVGWWKTDKGKESARKTKLKGRFGITVEEYEQMFTAQAGKCTICQTDQCTSGHRLSVDHDHTTGAVRSLLCKRCNLVIGNSGESPEILAAAIRYLEEHGGRQA